MTIEELLAGSRGVVAGVTIEATTKGYTVGVKYNELSGYTRKTVNDVGQVAATLADLLDPQ